MTELLKGDIVKVSAENIDKLGLISEIVDDTMIRVGKSWYLLEEVDIKLLHRELTQAS